MARRVFNILFLCAGNSARSIIAEAYLNSLKLPHLKAFSAGSAPQGEVHPLALSILSEAHIPIDGLQSKSWDEFVKPDAPAMDMVINLCEDSNKEAGHAWPGKPTMAHWAVPDPLAAPQGTMQERAAFAQVLAYVKQRTDFLQHFDEQQLENLSRHESNGPPQRTTKAETAPAPKKRRR